MTPRIVTPERAKEIEERLGKATPGPWDNEGTSYVYGMVPGGRPNGEILLCCSIRVFQGTHEQDKRNAEFIAHSWADLRDLLHTLAVEREERRVAEGEAMLLVESAEYKLGKALEENARLRAENEKLTELTRGFVTAIKWWAAQEDGLPEEVAPVFVGGMFVLGWEFSTNHDLQALAALAPREEGKL